MAIVRTVKTSKGCYKTVGVYRNINGERRFVEQGPRRPCNSRTAGKQPVADKNGFIPTRHALQTNAPSLDGGAGNVIKEQESPSIFISRDLPVMPYDERENQEEAPITVSDVDSEAAENNSTGANKFLYVLAALAIAYGLTRL